MAVPSSGEISLKGIHQELNSNNYSNVVFDGNSISLKECSDGTEATINTANASADRPNGSTPHNMSEFYAYDHDAVPPFSGYFVDDFTTTSTRTPADTRLTFANTSLGDSQSFPTTADNFVVATRPVWSALGGGTSSALNDKIRMGNTSNSNHSQWRTTNIDMISGTHTNPWVNISNEITIEFSFYMPTATTKDLNFFIETNSAVGDTWNSGTWSGYRFQFDDSSNRYIWMKKFTSAGSQTTIDTSSSNAFSHDTSQTCKIKRTSSGKWYVYINNSTVLGPMTDSTYDDFYGIRFMVARLNNSSGPVDIDWIRMYRSS